MGLMEIEMAKMLQKERMAEAERLRRRRNLKREARQERDACRNAAGTSLPAPRVDWPVFSFRIGRFRIAAFRTVRIRPGGPASASGC